MIDDERRMLAEIEDRLRMADPAFVARMTVSDPRPFPALSVLGVLLFITAPLVSLLYGIAVLAVITGMTLGVMAAVVFRRRRRPARM